MSRRCVLPEVGGRRAPRRPEDRGAAAVEFALVVPILLLLVFGIISYGFMLTFRQAISQAAAEGARSAAVAPSTTSTGDRQARAIAAINDVLSVHGVSCSGGSLMRNGSSAGTCSVSAPAACSAGGGAPATCVKVTLDYSYRDNPLLPGLGVGLLLPEHLRYVSEVRVS